eukprot:jgi/Bigna1/69855/fgenesh1_pg.10_\
MTCRASTPVKLQVLEDEKDSEPSITTMLCVEADKWFENELDVEDTPRPLTHPDEILEGFAKLDFKEFETDNPSHVKTVRSLIWLTYMLPKLDIQSKYLVSDEFTAANNNALQNCINFAHEFMRVVRLLAHQHAGKRSTRSTAPVERKLLKELNGKLCPMSIAKRPFAYYRNKRKQMFKRNLRNAVNTAPALCPNIQNYDDFTTEKQTSEDSEGSLHDSDLDAFNHMQREAQKKAEMKTK